MTAILQPLLPEGIRPECLVVVGPTASGKSAVGMTLAKALNGVIISCDSVQLYRGFDIGSAKPSLSDRQQVIHKMIDVFDWHQNCDAAIYAQMARREMAFVRSAGQIPIVVGGTGLYLRALLQEGWDEDIPNDKSLRAELQTRSSDDLFAELQRLDPRRAGQIHQNDRFRVVRALEINHLTGKPVPDVSDKPPTQRRHFLIWLKPDKEKLYDRINLRTKEMLASGLIEEVKGLLAQGIDPECRPMKSIGYKDVAAALHADFSLNNLEEQIALSTRQYAKRQTTWFQKMPADAVMSSLFDCSDLIDRLQNLLQ